MLLRATGSKYKPKVIALALENSSRPSSRPRRARGCALEGLAKIGAISKPSAKSVKMISKAANEIEKCCGAGKYTEKIEDMDDVGFFVKQIMLEYAALITEDDKSYEERTRRKSELRDILKSCCPSSKKSKK